MFSKMKARYKELLNETRTSDDPWQSEMPLSDCVKETAKVVGITSSIVLTVASKLHNKNSDGWRDGPSGYGYYWGDERID